MTFTSCKFTRDDRLQGQGGIQPFTICGELFHLQGPLHPRHGQAPSFAQLYFLDPDQANTARLAFHPGLRPDLLDRLERILRDCRNPFIGIYATAREQIESARGNASPYRLLLNPRLQLVVEKGSDRRRTNLPTANEVSVLIPDE